MSAPQGRTEDNNRMNEVPAIKAQHAAASPQETPDNKKPHCSPAPGGSRSAKDIILEAGAVLTQSFAPTQQICAHLNGFHVYAEDTSRHVEANHYCTHLTEKVRQCLIYDSPDKGARLIGVEYMITKDLFEALDAEEKKLWHSHDYEVHSGALIMPNSNVPDALWSVAERKEMEQVVGTYGKTWHMWQIDRGDELPLGRAQLMMSYTDESQVSGCKHSLVSKHLGDRILKAGVDNQTRTLASYSRSATPLSSKRKWHLCWRPDMVFKLHRQVACTYECCCLPVLPILRVPHARTSHVSGEQSSLLFKTFVLSNIYAATSETNIM